MNICRFATGANWRCRYQILIEAHACLQPLNRHHQLMTKLNHSFGVFSKEPNIEFSDGRCVEFGLLRRQPCKPSD